MAGPGPILRIRRAAAGDAERLAQFAERMFREAFGAENRPEDLAAHTAASYGAAKQRGEIVDPDIVTLLAEREDEWVGYAQVRRRELPERVTGAAVLELWRFYVAAPWHGRGVAQQLMAAVFDGARQLRGRTLWLSVWERNPRAIAFYAKSGFRDAGAKDFWVGADRQTDRLMIAAVPADPLPGAAGPLRVG
jgi:diamine N-acetyltransferase